MDVFTELKLQQKERNTFNSGKDASFYTTEQSTRSQHYQYTKSLPHCFIKDSCGSICILLRFNTKADHFT